MTDECENCGCKQFYISEFGDKKLCEECNEVRQE